jgi:hypothetical protein
MQNPNSHKKTQELKPRIPTPGTAIKAGLHPASKLVQDLSKNNVKKQG